MTTVSTDFNLSTVFATVAEAIPGITPCGFGEAAA